MKAVILGGYGVFGSRLAELLTRDGHEVWIAGRDRAKARGLAERLGAHALTLDLRTAPETLLQVHPDIVIDAAGPFQDYGSDPYRIPKLCIGNGVHYLDLSDDATFTAGISALDTDAKAAGCKVLSGVSSVPALSSSVVAHLARGMDRIELIDTAILPGNRAPRGKSVIAAIVGQLGRSVPVWRGGRWRETPIWLDKARIRLAPDLVRDGYFIPVPDVYLFPEFFSARSVIFRAGMELKLLNLSLSVLARLRRIWPFSMTARRAGVLRGMADLTRPFGTDRGGMRVRVVGKTGDGFVRRDWCLVADAGDGPFIPAVAARILLRRWDRVPTGARPCLNEFDLNEFGPALAGLRVSTQAEETPHRPLFQLVLGERWNVLPPEVRALHSVHDIHSFSGRARITRGRSLMARLAAWMFGFPAAGSDVPVTVTKTRTGDTEIWQRQFGTRVFRSVCSAGGAPRRFRERFWPFTFEIDLDATPDGMRFPVLCGWCLGLPLPRALLPISEAREFVENGLFHFDVALHAPLGGGLIVRYRGSLGPD